MIVIYSKFKVFESKDKGGRDSQQDDYYAEYNETLDKLVMVVADGMGGHKGGQIASEIVVKKTKQFFHDKNNENLSSYEFFKKLIPSIHESIFKRGLKDNISPHTTIVIALVGNGYIDYAHIGDSRLYIFTEEDKLVERTRDHSVPEMLFQMGEISEDDMATHPDQNKLTKSLGGERAESFTFKQHKIDASKNYAIVLCSDGLWEYFTDNQMNYALFKSKLALNDIGKKMIQKAKKVGGEDGDNITLLITKISSSQSVSNPLKILFNPRWAIVGIISILLGIGIYFMMFPSDKSSVKQSKEIGIENEVNIKAPKNVNQTRHKTEDKLILNKEWQMLNKIIIEGANNLEKEEGSFNVRAKNYKEFFLKHKTNFDSLIKRTNDIYISNEYNSLIKKAKDDYNNQDYNNSISRYYSILNILVSCTYMKGENN